MNLNDLKQPFEPADIEFRAGATNQDKTRALALAYIRSQAVQDRLDSVVGPENWKNEYQAGPGGGVMCILSIKVDGEWIPKAGIGENTDFEAVKGGESDALKRAAVRWGIGRYLYQLPGVWVAAEQRGKSVTIDEGEARQKLFGSGGQRQAPAPAPEGPKGNGKANGQARNFQTLKGLLAQIEKDFHLTEAQAKDKLREAGHNGFAVEKSGQMYQDVKKLMGGAK